MKFLRSFGSTQQRDAVLASIDYKILAKTAGVPGVGIMQGSHQSTPPNDEIWYTTDANIAISNNRVSAIYSSVQDRNSNTNELSIVSNTYSNGKGVLKFSGNVVALGWNCIAGDYIDGMSEICSVISIILPASFADAYASSFNSSQLATITSYGTMNGYDWKQGLS